MFTSWSKCYLNLLELRAYFRIIKIPMGWIYISFHLFEQNCMSPLFCAFSDIFKYKRKHAYMVGLISYICSSLSSNILNSKQIWKFSDIPIIAPIDYFSDRNLEDKLISTCTNNILFFFPDDGFTKDWNQSQPHLQIIFVSIYM